MGVLCLVVGWKAIQRAKRSLQIVRFQTDLEGAKSKWQRREIAHENSNRRLLKVKYKIIALTLSVGSDVMAVRQYR